MKENNSSEMSTQAMTKILSICAVLLLAGCATTPDPQHAFETCMDALGNVELPASFPAGEFCNRLEELQ